MKRIAIIVIVILAVTGIAFWWFSPKRVLLRASNKLLNALSFSQSNGKASRNLQTYSLNKLLAESVLIEVPSITEANGEFERSDLESGFSWLCNHAKQMKFEVTKVDSVSITGDAGTVNMEIAGLVELPSYRPADGTFRVTFDWRKHENGWRLVGTKWR